MSFELVHLSAGVVYLFFAVLWGLYAMRSLRLLYGTPEVLKTQRYIWIPILIGGIFFTVGGILHFAEKSALFVSPLIEEMADLLYDVFAVIGYAFLTVSVFRYWRLQKEYHELKREALQQIPKEHKQNGAI